MYSFAFCSVDRRGASDGAERVFQDAWLHDLEIPESKYYLADAEYLICDALWYLIRVFGITLGGERLVVYSMCSSWHPSTILSDLLF